ncbi:MAG: HAD-IA family hydrolase [Alistipes sp.]|nr:HAD-IA family hydrolase [Alistipes sp.]
MARYHTLLFDFDGTTANTMPAIIPCIRKVLSAEGISVSDEVIYHNAGHSVYDAIKHISGSENEDDVARYTEAYMKLYMSEGLSMIRPFPKVMETLQQFHDHGIKMAIASNNVLSVVVPMIESFGVMKYMDTIVCSDDVENIKPAPDIALEAMRRTGTPPEKTLVVGDSIFDIGMGVSAGTATCGVTYGCHSKQMLIEAGATYTIDAFDELLKIVLV